MAYAEALIVIAVIGIRLGQTLMCCGGTRSTHAAAACARLLLDLAVATLALWAVGTIWLPDPGNLQVITPSNFLGLGEFASAPMLRALPFLLLASGGVVSATQDRIRARAPLTLTIIFAAVLVPVALQLEERLAISAGPSDTGVGIAILIGGAAGLAAAWAVGPRKGKFNRDLSANVLPGHNVPMQYLGLLMLALGIACVNGDFAKVFLGLSAATLAGAAFGKLRFSKVDSGLLLAAAASGVVAAGAMTPAVPNWMVVLMSGVLGVVTPLLLMKIETGFRIDDAAGLCAGRLCGGTAALLLAPLCRTGIPGGNRTVSLLGNVGLLVGSVAIAAGIAWIVCKAYAASGALRLTEDEEFEGSDLAEFDLNAYPDFQQTMIKSHHLRQL